MSEERTGIRDLKARLSGYLARVKRGDTVLITDRGKPVARLVPVRASVTERVTDLAAAGVVGWSGKRLRPSPPVPRLNEDVQVSDLLLEDRD